MLHIFSPVNPKRIPRNLDFLLVFFKRGEVLAAISLDNNLIRLARLRKLFDLVGCCLPPGGINAYLTLLAPAYATPPHSLCDSKRFDKPKADGAAGASRGMPSYVAGKVDDTTLTRGARNRVNRFPGNVPTDTRHKCSTYTYRRLQEEKKEKERGEKREKKEALV